MNLRCVALLCLLTVSGCKATEAPNSGFIERADQLASHDSKPFHGWWANRDADWGSLTEVHVPLVDLTHLGTSWENLIHFAKFSNQEEGARQIARYMQKYMLAAFRDDPDKRFKVVNTPGPKTLVLELSLVELVATRSVLNLAGYVVVGLPVDWGTTAFEGRARLGPGGPVIAKFKDREHGQPAIFSMADFFWYAHAKHSIDAWAEQLVGSLKGEDVDDTLPFTLRPW